MIICERLLNLFVVDHWLTRTYFITQSTQSFYSVHSSLVTSRIEDGKRFWLRRAQRILARSIQERLIFGYYYFQISSLHGLEWPLISIGRVQQRFGGMRDGELNRGGMRDTRNTEGGIRDVNILAGSGCPHFNYRDAGRFWNCWRDAGFKQHETCWNLIRRDRDRGSESGGMAGWSQNWLVAGCGIWKAYFGPSIGKKWCEKMSMQFYWKRRRLLFHFAN